jgi:hypothetical protein
MKRIFRFLVVACLFWVVAGCEGFGGGGRANLYVQYELNRDVSQLYYISYVPEGNDGHSGKNILPQRLGEYTFRGNKYHMFHIPRGIWDIYFEWYDDVYANSSGFDNERCTVNTRQNEWARLDCYDKSGFSYWVRQGDGEMY